MKAAVLDKPFHFRIEERPVPELRPGFALVRVRAAGICGSDLHFYSGEMPMACESIRGHEIAGEIADPGDTGFRTGQPVAIHPIVGCGECPACIRGEKNICEHLKFIGGDYPGGFEEYIAVPSQNIYPYDKRSFPFNHAALTDCVAVAVHTVNRMRLKQGESVLVMGDGTIGLLLARTALVFGADPVVLLGKHKKNMDIAKRLGVNHTVSTASCDPAVAIQEMIGDVDIVLESVGGDFPPFALGLSILRKGGRFAVLGLTGETKLDVPWLDFVLDEKSLTGLMGYSMYGNEDEFQKALDLMESGRIILEPVITHIISLDDINQGFKAMLNKNKSGCVKAIVSFK